MDSLRIGEAALENGKHVFVEKPFTFSGQQAEELIELAERKNLKIMVDHTFCLPVRSKRSARWCTRAHSETFIIMIRSV